MNKKDLVERVSKKTKMTKKEVALIVDTVFEEMANVVQSNEKVVISNFGTFEKQERSGYMGVHPVTGEPIKIEDHTKISFKSSKRLRGMLHESD